MGTSAIRCISLRRGDEDFERQVSGDRRVEPKGMQECPETTRSSEMR